MTTRAEALRAATRALTESGIENAGLDARLLLQHCAKIPHEALVASPETSLSEAEQHAYQTALSRRASREPLSHIVGTREFWGRPFHVTPATLIPRPDSETLIEVVLDMWPDRTAPLRILDLGTGTGCLLLTLLAEYKNATGTGIDLNPQALETAKNNAESLGLAPRAAFKRARWCEGLTGQFEIIVANPPYIASNALATLMPEVVEFEPHLALDGGADGLECYRQIANEIPPYMTPASNVVLEVGEGQMEAVADIFSVLGLRAAAKRRDLAGIPRCLVLGI